MATAWDVDTAIYQNKYKYVGSEDTSPTGVFFKPDGTKMYVAGYDSDTVYQYSLSTPWDVLTADYDGKYKLIEGEWGENELQDVFFKADGLKMYALGDQYNSVYEYSLSTAWDIETASYVRYFGFVEKEEAPRCFFFKPDGTVMYIAGSGPSNWVLEYSLSTAWNVSTASYVRYFAPAVGRRSLQGLFIKADGLKMYIMSGESDSVNQYTLSTAWNLDTVTYDEKYKNVNSEDTSTHGVIFKPDDGSRMYFVGGTNDTVYQYALVVQDPPTNVQATNGVHTDKVVITWTKSDGATDYQVYRDGTPLGWLGDVATYDDTGAAAPTITPGTATASKGTYEEHVALSLSGQSANNGTIHNYKVRAINGSESGDSETNTGYRGHDTLTYQWQRSALDSDADYSNISGATTASYNDTGAPENGDGRYYKCVEDATGATQQTSSVNRGYRYSEEAANALFFGSAF